MVFIFNVIYIESKSTEPFYLHLECDLFIPDLMYTEPGMNKYIQWRMCPPGRSTYFFSSEGKIKLNPNNPAIKQGLRKKV